MNLLDKIKSILNIDSDESKPANRTATSDVSSYESNSSDASGNGTVDTEADLADTQAKTDSPGETLTEVEEAEDDAPEEHPVDDASGEAGVTAGVDTESGDETDSESDTQTEAETQTETDAQTDTESTSDAEAVESEPVNVIKGVGTTYAERLGEAGIETVDELAAADPEALAEETEISTKRVERWVGRAEHR